MKQPLLTKEDEQQLTRAWKHNRDSKALDRLIRAYSRLAVSSALKYKKFGLPVSDLIQEANVGLMQAADKFDPDRDVRFSTYSAWWIKAAIQEYILRNWSMVRIGSTSSQRKLFFNLRRLKSKLEEQSSSLPYDNMSEEIAKQLEVPVRDVDYMSGRLDKSDQSLNAIAFDESGVELQDLLADERPNPEVILSGSTDAKIRADIISRAMAELSPREYTIIKRRRLSDEKVTLESLGQEFGVSKERVRQLEARALGSIKDAISSIVERPSDLY
jgi:RNA polymerase sigma-32 factor